MPLINRKVELKLKWTKYCVLSWNSTGNANDDDNANNIIFTVYVLVVTLATGDNQRLSKCLNKGFERSVYWNEY